MSICRRNEVQMINIRKFGAALLLFAALSVFTPQPCQAVEAAEQMDGVMGQSLREEAKEGVIEGEQYTEFVLSSSTGTAATQRAANITSLSQGSFVTTDSYRTGISIYYHKKAYENRLFLKGIDVSWWQSKGKADPVTQVQSNLNWTRIHQAGIDFAFVRVGSRDTKDHTIYEDTCANDHIKKASGAGLKVGVYFFSQARTAGEAKEEAEFLLKKIRAYGWDITMPLVIDREPGRGLKSGQLSKAAETAVCQAFADTVTRAGYRACVYASYSWINDYIDTGKLKNCGFWIARYHNTTTSNGYAGAGKYPGRNAYADVAYNYSFWQYSQYAKVNGFSGCLDANFGYIDTKPQVTGVKTGTVTDRTATLNWNFGNHVLPYQVMRYNEAKKTWEVRTNPCTYQTTFQDSGLAAGTTYRYKVRTYWKLNGKEYLGPDSKEIKITTEPDRVSGFKVDSIAETTLSLSWNPLSWADGYRVYRYDPLSKKTTLLAETAAGTTNCRVTGLSTAREYQFKVRAFRNTGTGIELGHCPDILKAKTLPPKVTGVKASGELASMVKVSWKPVAGADGYGIYRLDPENGSPALLTVVRNGAASSWNHTGLAPLTTYQYQVRAFTRSNGQDGFGVASGSAVALTGPAKLTGFTVSANTSTVTLRWNKMSGVAGYRIYRQESKTKKYVLVKVLSGDTVTSYQDKNRASACVYNYKVRAYVTVDGRNGYGDYTAVKTAVTLPAKVTGLQLSATDTTVTVKWNRVSRASGYQVYRWNGTTKKYEYIKYVKGGSITSYVNSGRSAGTKYRYRVRAYFAAGGKNYYGSYSDAKEVNTKPATVKKLSASSKSSAVTLKWNRSAGASGYEIYRYSSTGKYVKIATVKNSKTVSYRNTKLKKGKTYYYKVRAYQTKNGKTYYGSFASPVKIKVK